MSVDHQPTCPNCGGDLVYQPQPAFSIVQLAKSAKGDWQCPECGEWFDIPDWVPDIEEEEE